MPELARFYGIVVQVYYGDHRRTFTSDTRHIRPRLISKPWLSLMVICRAGAKALVMEWADLHREELREAFRKASHLQQPDAIDPLP